MSIFVYDSYMFVRLFGTLEYYHYATVYKKDNTVKQWHFLSVWEESWEEECEQTTIKEWQVVPLIDEPTLITKAGQKNLWNYKVANLQVIDK